MQRSNNLKFQKTFLLRSSIMIVLLILSMALLLKFIHNYNNPTLYGKWQSQLTGEIITFQKNGQVIIDGVSDTSKFTLIKPTQMLYEINEKTFAMYYWLEGRNLYWGTDPENLELFVKN